MTCYDEQVRFNELMLNNALSKHSNKCGGSVTKLDEIFKEMLELVREIKLEESVDE